MKEFIVSGHAFASFGYPICIRTIKAKNKDQAIKTYMKHIGSLKFFVEKVIEKTNEDED